MIPDDMLISSPRLRPCRRGSSSSNGSDVISNSDDRTNINVSVATMCGSPGDSDVTTRRRTRRVTRPRPSTSRAAKVTSRSLIVTSSAGASSSSSHMAPSSTSTSSSFAARVTSPTSHMTSVSSAISTMTTNHTSSRTDVTQSAIVTSSSVQLKSPSRTTVKRKLLSVRFADDVIGDDFDITSGRVSPRNDTSTSRLTTSDNVLIANPVTTSGVFGAALTSQGQTELTDKRARLEQQERCLAEDARLDDVCTDYTRRQKNADDNARLSPQLESSDRKSCQPRVPGYCSTDEPDNSSHLGDVTPSQYDDIPLPKDPRQWSRLDVRNWLKHMERSHSLENVDPDRFQMNGKALCLMNADMFLYRVPLDGRVLHTDFQLRLCRALGINIR